jgi:hypothetical protein
VAIEGVSAIDGRFIVPGALVPDDRAHIPVMHGENIVGYAARFKRDRRPQGGLDISFEFHMMNAQTGLMAKTQNATIFCTNLETSPGRNGALVIHKAVIREIQICGDYWAWRE